MEPAPLRPFTEAEAIVRAALVAEMARLGITIRGPLLHVDPVMHMARAAIAAMQPNTKTAAGETAGREQQARPTARRPRQRSRHPNQAEA